MPLEVPQDPTSRRHAARRDHREEAAAVEQAGRFRRSAHELQEPRVQRPHVAREQLAHLGRLVLCVAQVDRVASVAIGLST